MHSDSHPIFVINSGVTVLTPGPLRLDCLRDYLPDKWLSIILQQYSQAFGIIASLQREQFKVFASIGDHLVQ